MSRLRAAVPPWLAHALRAQRGPVPWSAVVRGALAAGPLLLAAVQSGRTSVGVVAALGAMLAGINDRPGSRRAAVRRLGVPALAGAGGLLVGSYAGQHVGAVTLTLLLTVLGLLAGAVSAVGPVASGAGTQLLVAAAIGAGMPLPEPGWQRALFFVAGAGWLLVLRLALPTPGATAGDYRFDGERDAVGGVYDAVAALLEAVGGPDAPGRRVALTAALDHAQDALGGPRLRRYASSAAERRLHAQYAAALPLAEAATALAWAGDAVPARAVEGPRRLAVAVRTSTHTGPLPAPARSAPALRALDDALLHAADAFDGGGDDSALHTRRRTAMPLAHTVLGSGGREYGLRVALCFGASVAVAQALHHARWYGSHSHWYWLPATAVFLVKPDLGPLASRVICRAAGTVLGAVLFAGFAALLPRPAGLVALVALCGALIPVATRHFAAQTAVVTVLVLSLVMVGGEPQASWSRIGETLLACAIVLLVGHLPALGQRGGGVRARLTRAAEAAHLYLAHVLDDGTTDDRAGRWALRREAYRALAEARASIDLAAAELPALARHAEGTDEVAATLERLVDTTTACAVQLDDTGRLTPQHSERIAELLAELAEGRERAGLAVKEGQAPPVPLAG
ncbi:FUSC family protein [Streptomyces sp. RLB1-33]|uniref:FUSC family protein n=1 Tax=Streptomyces mirabilis TaxID=68239 RepID=UPI00143E9DA5|nr:MULTISPECIES: FUSC family protein [Streptomyces]QIY70419.1 FUSC family protein [Streptomyces sp. RLB1-33]QUW82686.1 FUSC family protein [Streptomyces mirabilis]